MLQLPKTILLHSDTFYNQEDSYYGSKYCLSYYKRKLPADISEENIMSSFHKMRELLYCNGQMDWRLESKRCSYTDRTVMSADQRERQCAK